MSKLMEYPEIEKLDNSFRESAIIHYIKKHKGCSISDIVRYAKHKKIAAKRTVEKITDILIEKEKKHNSRNYTLSIKNNNPLVVIPDQLEELEKLFKTFTA